MRAIRRCPGTPGSSLLPPLLALALALPAHAQDSLSLHVGEVVRVELRGQRGASYVGRLLACEHDSLVLAARGLTSSAVSFAGSDISRTWVSDRDSRRTAEGLAIGLVAGAAMGAVANSACVLGACFDLVARPSATTGAMVGGAVGLVVGAIVGSTRVRHHWRPVEWPPAVARAPTGAERVALVGVPLGGGSTAGAGAGMSATGSAVTPDARSGQAAPVPNDVVANDGRPR